MLLRYIRWEGEDIVIEMYDVDGSHAAFTLNVPDGLDLAAWLARERNKMLEIMRITEKRIAEKEEEPPEDLVVEMQNVTSETNEDDPYYVHPEDRPRGGTSHE